jgi:response regulator RpfG family c-di-GMP phosphodiesterase
MSALSIATDLGMGQPLEFALASCLAALRLGERCGLSTDDLRAVYYQALLRYIGCNAETYLLASVFGDELAFRTTVVHADTARPEFLAFMMRFIRQANTGASPLEIVQAVTSGITRMGQAQQDFFEGHCQVAQRLAERIGLEPHIITALVQVYARWDGKGIPALKSEVIAPSMLIVSLAQDAVFFARLEGLDTAIKIARERSGTMYAPKQVEIFCKYAREILSDLDEPSLEQVVALEPGQKKFLNDAQFDAVCEVLADFTDIKSPWLLNHSSGVARLAREAAQRAELDAKTISQVYRAALLHDMGRVGVSAGVWGKAGPLTLREWEHVRLHPYYTERILAQPDSLADLSAIASAHHERLDGSGYHRRINAAQLSNPARLLAAADVYHALTEARPHRAAFTANMAAQEVQRQAKSGTLDADAVNFVLQAAGHHISHSRQENVAGLSERELEVLRLIARGMTMRQIATALVISTKTVDSHIQHIYQKIGVSTRAGATLFAMEKQLL